MGQQFFCCQRQISAVVPAAEHNKVVGKLVEQLPADPAGGAVLRPAGDHGSTYKPAATVGKGIANGTAFGTDGSAIGR